MPDIIPDISDVINKIKQNKIDLEIRNYHMKCNALNMALKLISKNLKDGILEDHFYLSINNLVGISNNDLNIIKDILRKKGYNIISLYIADINDSYFARLYYKLNIDPPIYEKHQSIWQKVINYFRAKHLTPS